MIKKLFYAMMAGAMLLATSCEKGLDEVATVDETATVSFNIGTPEIATRAEYGEGNYATQLQYAVYDIVNEEYVHLGDLDGKTQFSNGKAVVSLELATNNQYQVVFWADAWGNKGDEIRAPYSFNPREMEIEVNYDYTLANDEKLDAFYASVPVEVKGAESLSVTLTRPLAQLNIGTNDSVNAEKAGIVPTTSVIEVDAYSAMNLISGKVTGSTQKVTFKEKAIATDMQFPVFNNKYIAMAYLLVEEKETVDVTFSYTTETGKTFSRTVGSVPVERNSRTNIYGKLLTSSMDVTVEIKPGFDEPTYDVYNVRVNEVSYDNFAEAVAKALELNMPIEFIQDVAIDADDTITIPAGQTLTLNLNGYTLTGVTDDADKNDDGKLTSADNEVMFDVRGVMNVFGGTVTTKHIGANLEWNGCTEIFYVAFNGTLHVENATLINYGGSSMAYAIDMVNASTENNGITVEVFNSTVKSSYIPVRVFNNGAGMNNVTIKDSTLDGVSRAFWVHVYSSKDNGNKGVKDSTLNINIFNPDCGNTFKASNPERIIEYGFDDEINLREDGTQIFKTVPTELNFVDGERKVLIDLEADNTLVLSGRGTLVLDNIHILTESGSAIELAEGAEITIEIVNNEIENDVTLTGATNGILVPAGAALTVTGEGNLVVEGKNGSGIGAKGVEAGAGNITISGLAHITAKGNGDHAFGIGGNNSNVVIANSTVDYACGGHIQPLFVNDEKYGKSEPEGGAAIGGATIKIEGSTITKVDGGSKAAAIGAQYWQSTSIEIIDSTIEEANGGNASAGIGGGRYASDSKHNVSIVIKGSEVTATGGQGGAGIGSGYDTHCNGENFTATNYIEIDGTSTINAKGGKYAAGIGTGFHSAYLSGSIADGATINAESGENFYKDSYTTAQNIGYGVVDPAREFSGNNANVTFTVNGQVIEHPHPAVTIGGVAYGTFEAAIAAAQAGQEVTLVSDVTLASELTLPAGITLNGNGYQINGTIVAGGDLTFAGHTKVTSFSASYYDRTITIGEGACLEVTGGDRVSFAYGNTFNVTGSITDANNADKTTIQPSLIIPAGISITGGRNATFNITNAYVQIGNTSSKNSAANGTFNINITNSIAEFTNQLTFAEPTSGMNPTFNINVTNSVLTTATKLCIAATNTTMVVDNSTVTLGTYFRNSGKVELKNGSVLEGKTIQFGENGGNDGTITVDASSLTITAGSTGHAFDGKGSGSITLKNGAEVNVDYFKDMTINADVSSTFTTLTTMPSVAKVGNTEYPFIDQAIAAWTNNTTLTLLDNVTLSGVVTLKSTEYHVLDLGTYTLTAAKGKDAISITAEGRTSASYALDIKADATNPGGITATSKAVVKTTGKSGVKDRPIIRFYNGVFNATNVISHSGSNGTNCPQFQFHNGVYNCNLSANRALIQIYGGTFNGKFFTSVDSSAYLLISGGKFKSLDNLYGSALNSDKFTIGSSKGNFDRGVYVDGEGYFVVGGAAITEFGDQFVAKTTKVSNAGSYLPYSSAAANGLYFTNAEVAEAMVGAANVVLK